MGDVGRGQAEGVKLGQLSVRRDPGKGQFQATKGLQRGSDKKKHLAFRGKKGETWKFKKAKEKKQLITIGSIRSKRLS